MRITVLLFAHLADAFGARSLSLDLPEGAMAGDVLEELIRRAPQAAPFHDRLAVAVDERYVPADQPLREGAVVAVIPPVSGG